MTQRAAVALFLLSASALVGGVFSPANAAPGKVNPIVVIGLDGLEISVLEALEKKGVMPNFMALRKRGVSTKLITGYGAASPIVWTTVATGVDKEDHGITGFAIDDDAGASPISSTMRKVPAIWNMVSAANKKVLVLGWWGSWPAETVNGVVMSDRALKPLEGRVSPADYESAFAKESATLLADKSIFVLDADMGSEDRLVTGMLTSHLDEGYDLSWAYLHGIDVVSHKYWKYWEPEKFKDVSAESLAANKDVIPGKYRAMDAALGKIVAAAPKNTNFVLLSDHGFGPLSEQFVKVGVELDLILQAGGLLVRSGTNLDTANSTAYTSNSAMMQMRKWVKFGAKVSDREAAKAKVVAWIGSCTWGSGKPALSVKDPVGKQKEKADLVIDVLTEGVDTEMACGGTKMVRVVKNLIEHSGGHGWEPPGVFFAAGPDIDPKANLEGIRIHDITPTVLYGMGLPVAEDFDGKVFESLFTSAFRTAHPKQTIKTYGSLGAGNATKSAQTDKEMVEQLRELGYIE